MVTLGFKGTGLFDDSTYHSFYRKLLPENRAVVVIGTVIPKCVNVFILSEKQWAAYRRGSLGLVPTGCCSASGRAHVEPTVEVEHDELDFKKVKAIMAVLEPCIRELWPSRKELRERKK